MIGCKFKSSYNSNIIHVLYVSNSMICYRSINSYGGNKLWIGGIGTLDHIIRKYICI